MLGVTIFIFDYIFTVLARFILCLLILLSKYLLIISCALVIEKDCTWPMLFHKLRLKCIHKIVTQLNACLSEVVLVKVYSERLETGIVERPLTMGKYKRCIFSFIYLSYLTLAPWQPQWCSS